MKSNLVRYFLCFICLFAGINLFAQPRISSSDLEKVFNTPPASAKPWVFWYWMHAAVSREGIKADLEAMKEVGIGGAYLMPIKDTTSRIPYQPTARQLTPEWWALVKYAMEEAKRLDLQLAMHVSDGFALAGGPWITPERSMQKLVWTKTYIKSGHAGAIKLEQPETKENYYKDIAVLAYPANYTIDTSLPSVTTSTGADASFLPDPKGKGSFRSDTTCWIQYKYARPFTLRSIRVHVGGNNYQAQRLIIQTSDDGIAFKTITRLVPPRHGWQDTDEDYTYAIPATTSQYFRLVYDKDGTEPGSEDLDAAKWKPSLKVNGIYFSSEPTIHQYETKNGSVWRVADNTTAQQVTDKDAVPIKSIINLSTKVDKDGNLQWKAPQGDWIIVRIGHTSTGHTNYTGGAALGLECDKFNPAAVKLQFDSWFAKAFEKTDPALAKEVLKIFHVDSWECGSQNWSPVFAAEFKKRRGYDLTNYLLAMTGVPVVNASISEKFLHDVRQTIADLVQDVFYKNLATLARQKGVQFSAEAIAPTMVSDGLLHYKQVDLPMGEFWLNSPTHDKPNDMMDAISGAHIYGKNIIMAESFTSVRMNWAEHPGNLKIVGDRNFALGINKMVLHVFTQNPWIDKKPGMTLDGVGLYFQRDQTWFKQSKAWIEYLTRCSALLQAGKPVADIAVFTGEEVPRRAVLPDRLVNTLPGVFGRERVESEKIRLANKGEPLRQIPDGVTNSANTADPEDWIDPLNGYAYDSFNPDALMMMSVKDGKVVLPGGASYSMLVFPGKHPLHPNHRLISLPVAKKILQLVKDGATVVIDKEEYAGIGMADRDSHVRAVMNELFNAKGKKGTVIQPLSTERSRWTSRLISEEKVSSALGREDVHAESASNSIAWNHRITPGADIYFISNQADTAQKISLHFRSRRAYPEIWDPLTGSIFRPDFFNSPEMQIFGSTLEPGQSLFFVFRDNIDKWPPEQQKERPFKQYQLSFLHDWSVRFDKNYGGPVEPIVMKNLQSWSIFNEPGIRYYSGSAVYSNTFTWKKNDKKTVTRVMIDSIHNIASVKINGTDCGTLWTRPFVLDIGHALKDGENTIEITVSNTWHNRLIGDNLLPATERVTWTTAPFRLRGKALLPAGLTGKVNIFTDLP